MDNTGDPVKSFWQFSAEEALTKLSSTKTGLSSLESSERLKQYGRNSIQSKTGNSPLRLFLSQFKSPITLMLIAAALLSAFLGDIPDTVIILVIVVISSFLGYYQEKGASDAIKVLLKMVQLHCDVLRDGKKVELTLEEVVPGDIVVLTAGDVIPGDSILIESQELFVDEAAFTGETFPVEKNPGILPAETPLSKRSNSLFMGSHVISGKAHVLIVKTGKETEFGKISAGIGANAPETDFEKGIRKFGYLLMQITLLLVILLFAINVYLHKPVLDSFLFSLALAVGLTPQLLPAIISVNLATGAKRMAGKQVIVKKLSSIENLGSMNLLCSDKTGTITEGKVNLKDALDINGNHKDKVLEYAWLNASLQLGFKNPIDLAICADYKGKRGEYTVQTEIPYDFNRKRLTIQVHNEKENFAITKGSLNSILDICNQAESPEGLVAPIDGQKAAIQKQYEELSASGLRTLGVAYKPGNSQKDFTRADEKDMIFLGFLTLFDPIKTDVKEIIEKMKTLGVKIKFITGDNALVARSLAKQIGIENPHILTGADLLRMSSSALSFEAPITDIFAEVEPNQKERIISVLKRAGNVVGFMGDGINDAAALHMADVGISVNTAVDVAKEAADIVLLSSGLEVLLDGIMEGRKTFTNTMKYIIMSTSANFGNMFSMAGASLFLPFLPLLPKQILLTNLLTDLPEMTISSDRVDSINVASPQVWDLRFLRRFMIIFGLLSSVFDYLTFGVLIFFLHTKEKGFQTTWFLESVISAITIVLVVRTRLPFFKSLPGKWLFLTTLFVLSLVLALPFTPMAYLFGFIPLPLSYYGYILLIVVSYIGSAEMAKKWFYKKMANGTRQK